MYPSGDLSNVGCVNIGEFGRSVCRVRTRAGGDLNVNQAAEQLGRRAMRECSGFLVSPKHSVCLSLSMRERQVRGAVAGAEGRGKEFRVGRKV